MILPVDRKFEILLIFDGLEVYVCREPQLTATEGEGGVVSS